ncbi:MAG: hypothetical protein UHU19_02075 [Lachnospiraceae bacterium]|nr:hypothetical protein [Lachnospiraceae bacterium]
MLKRINDALPGLVMGILFYGVIVEVIGVWFVSDKWMFTSGLLIGLAVAVAMAIHIATTLWDAVDIADAEHAKKIIAKSILRYVLVILAFLLVIVFHLGNMISMFIGVMGLKVSAYLQPYLMKWKEKKFSNEI